MFLQTSSLRGMATDFSIRAILGHHRTKEYEWLHCSRYRPPKLCRSKKYSRRRSRPSRTPRIPFTSGQLLALEQRFKTSPYLSIDEAAHLSSLLQLSETRVKVWFQNRRARERRVKGLQLILPIRYETRLNSGPKDARHWSAFRPVQSCPGKQPKPKSSIK